MPTSSAFLAPESALHLQFAYYESALVVEYLVERFGREALRGLLDDLGAGLPIDEALPGRTDLSLEELDADFADFARRRAEAVAPGATWEEPELPPDADSAALADWLAEHPVGEWPRRFLKNWNPKRDFAYAMLHAERLTRLLADEAIAELLWAQASAHPERREVLERHLERAEPRARFLLEEITSTGDRLLKRLGRGQAETNQAAG